MATIRIVKFGRGDRIMANNIKTEKKFKRNSYRLKVTVAIILIWVFQTLVAITKHNFIKKNKSTLASLTAA